MVFLTLPFFSSIYLQYARCKLKATTVTVSTSAPAYLRASPHASICQRWQIAQQKPRNVGSRTTRTEAISINLYTLRHQTSRTRRSANWDRMACRSVSYWHLACATTTFLSTCCFIFRSTRLDAIRSENLDFKLGKIGRHWRTSHRRQV